ncbi:sialidase family protein [Paenibacillus contaminans]|uniref:Sialidase domain-containing protein n=1 Tax=Paenibacillus contaminans TaxID=450362 RepID=A0A329LU22_9BACL|nr:sialidase family protein [Paenibacillus contaminans]RAV11485.1 hypothetical protein DQG23_36175 [Paenibacillus contaminans]
MQSHMIHSAVAELLYEDSNYNVGPVIVLSDGSLFTIMGATKKSLHSLDRTISSHYVFGRQSFDRGRTWTNPETIVSFPRQPGWISGVHLLQSRDGFVHVFSIRITAYNWEENDFQGDILHTRMDDIHGTNAVTQKVMCLDRYTGAINSVLQTSGGRIVVPFSTLVQSGNGESLCFVCSTIFSDDEGMTWQVSNDLSVSDGETHVETGAMEPIIGELDNGSLLMLIRTTLGHLYYALSADGGASWGEVKRTGFRSSNSPSSLVRLDNGDLVKIWNHCEGYPSNEAISISYARQAMHAAISEDGGITWNGYREIVHRRTDDPADTHISYPFPTAFGGDDVLVKYFTVQSKDGEAWIEPHAKIVQFSATFLKERTMTEWFDRGLAAWTTGGRGVSVSEEEGKPVMQLAAEASSETGNETAVACLNFPYGSAGSLRITMKAASDLSGAKLILSELYIDPVHYTSSDEAVRQITEKVLQQCIVIDLTGSADLWRELLVSWDVAVQVVHVTAADGTGSKSIAIRGKVGGYSYATLCVESANGKREQLSIAMVKAESHRGGVSDIDM